MFPLFRATLRDRGVVDFDEQIYAAIEALLADGPFRAEMQRRCRHLLVDEFQDLTPAHVLLIRLLSLPALDVFGVGDDDQCIYGYAGADPGFLIDYDALFPGAGAHALRTNYRCPTEVVTAAATLLGYNHRRVAKDIVAGAGNDASPGALRIVEHDADDGADSDRRRSSVAGSPRQPSNRCRSPCSPASTRCCWPPTSPCPPPASRSTRS